MRTAVYMHSLSRYLISSALDVMQNDNNGNDLPTGLHQTAHRNDVYWHLQKLLPSLRFAAEQKLPPPQEETTNQKEENHPYRKPPMTTIQTYTGKRRSGVAIYPATQKLTGN